MSTTTNGSATAKKIEFIQFHEPALEDGDYEITVTQTIQSTDNNVPKTEFPSAPTKFSVAGPRFSLSPQEIHSVFPPDGSLGEHSNVLPHIILNRSTLPWERLAVEGQTPPCPWLALLLFDDDEKPTPQVVQLKTLTESAVNPAWPGVTEESAQHDDDKVTVIDIPKNLLTGIAPTASDLCWLTHIRQTYFTLAIERKSDLNTGVLSEELRSAFKDNGVALSSKTTILVKAADSEWEIHDEGNAGVFAISPDKEPATELQVRDASQDELAVVICNRLPQQSGTSTVHLVSVEGRYNKDGFDLQGAGDTVRLVSLKSWSFSCVDEKQTFQNLLLNLDRNPSTLRLPDSAVIQANPAATRAVGRALFLCRISFAKAARQYPGTTDRWFLRRRIQRSTCRFARPTSWCATTRRTACSTSPMRPPGNSAACWRCRAITSR